MSRPLLSVITGTWRRRDLLMEAIENVRRQTYRPLEHVIVSDGPDAVLRDMLADELDATDVPIRLYELGRHWSGVIPDSVSAAPFMTAQLLAQGEYIAWWADDERALVPDHLEALVDLLEATGADFAYPKVAMWWRDNPEMRWTIGGPHPSIGAITHVVHRWDCLDVAGGGFRLGVGDPSDWDQIERWLAAGKTHAFLDRVTFQHRSDK